MCHTLQALVSELVRMHIFEKDLKKYIIGDRMFPDNENDLFRTIARALKPVRERDSSMNQDTFTEVCYM